MAKIDRKRIEHVAGLARLRLTAEEIETFTLQLDDILTHFEKLGELDTSGVEPTAHVIELSNALREDASRKSPSREHMLENAPETDRGCFKVPRIV
ncbi:Asp-tRNA(Asn)/Glu-tRNA(Gln) amidotransferase subunit GatC [Thermodesulfobacteriota bacterium]